MLGRARTATVIGLDAVEVTVEVHIGPGLPGFHVLGASGAAAREAGDRVRAALRAIGVAIPSQKVLVSLAPADVAKSGARFDLAMAMAVMSDLGEVDHSALMGTALIGELALDGALRGVRGVLPCAEALARAGAGRLIVAEANGAEAALVDSLEVVVAADLSEAVAVVRADRPPRRAPAGAVAPARAVPDLVDVRGQAEARRGLEIAAAGGHHVLLIGPPGCGKSMLAARLPGILPPLSREEAFEVAAIRSVAGRLDDDAPLDHAPPLSAPHQGATVPALIGGGSGIPRPGAISLAHRGVLVLDELLEWPRSLLEALRAPLQEGVVRIARSQHTTVYPAEVLLVGCANPCPCGGGPRCACTDEDVWRYRGRLSGALADRLDLAPGVEALAGADLIDDEAGESSAEVARRVAAARTAAASRWGSGAVNARVRPRDLAVTATRAARASLADAVDRGELTGRGHDRVLAVARTIADLDGAEGIGVEHAREARAHRQGLAAPSAPAVMV